MSLSALLFGEIQEKNANKEVLKAFSHGKKAKRKVSPSDTNVSAEQEILHVPQKKQPKSETPEVKKHKKSSAKPPVSESDNDDESNNNNPASKERNEDESEGDRGYQKKEKVKTAKKKKRSRDENDKGKGKTEKKLAVEQNLETEERDVAEAKPKQRTKPKKSENTPQTEETEEENVKEDDPEKLARTIFVGNIPVSVKTKHLKKYFANYGKVESVRFRSFPVATMKYPRKVLAMKKQSHPNRETCNAYIVFENRNEALLAVEKTNGQVFENKHLRVDMAENDNTNLDYRTTIFVGNMPLDVEDENLWETFGQCGEIECVRIVRDKKTNIGKGFGFVCFKDSSSVVDALKLNMKANIGDRPARITKCTRNGKREKVKPHIQRKKDFAKDRRPYEGKRPEKDAVPNFKRKLPGSSQKGKPIKKRKK